MKKKLLIFIFLAASIINCLAQPNSGFENWHNEYSYHVPDNWATLNILSVIPPFSEISVSKATGLDKHSGNYALKLKTVLVRYNPYPNLIFDSCGTIFTGKATLSPPSYIYGFPYTGRPSKLEFWCKYSPVGNDTAGVRVYMQKWIGGHRDTIAFSEMKVNATAAYTLFQLPITYNYTETPDSAVILFGSSMNKYISRLGSTLFIDDVSFTGWVGIEQHDLYSEKAKVFPNPAADAVNITAHFDEASSLKVTDANGKTAGLYKIQNYGADINTSSFAEGIYVYEIFDRNNHCLTKGKFNVVK